jgi:beta-lactamase regulating signal transducer with metallopeptidase domain
MDAVLNWLWQGGVVAVALGVMLFSLERASANVRSVVCWAAALFVIALPALPSLSSTATLPEAFRATGREAMVSLPEAWWTSTLVILAAWTLWAGIQVVRFISAIVAIRRARAHSRAFPSHAESVLPCWRRVRGEGRVATLVLSDSVTTAAVLSWGAPVIAVAPSLLKTLDADELDRVLIHEWAHVQRRDDLVNMLQIVVRIIAGWHPALWWIDRRLRIEREIACDEITVAVTGSAKAYAQCLVKLSSLRGTSPALRMAPAVFTPAGLRARVMRIVSPHASIAPAWSRSIAAASVMSLSLISAGVGGRDVVEAAALVLPLVPSRILTTTLDRVAPNALPPRSLDRLTGRSLRPARGQASSSARRPTAEPPAPSLPPRPPRAEPAAPPATEAANQVGAASAAEADARPAAGEPVPTERPIPLEGSEVRPEPAQSPWSAVASGGKAVGRTSKDASVATAGFFSRFGRRVAGSF